MTVDLHTSKEAVKPRGGASLVKAKPLFSLDSKYLFVCVGDVVRVYSTNSGEKVRDLKGHREPVCCVYLEPRNPLQVFSLAGQSIILWDYTDGSVLRKYSLPRSAIAFWFVYLERQEEAELNVILLTKNQQTQYDLVIAALPSKPQSVTTLKCSSLITDTGQRVADVAVGCKNEYVVTVMNSTMKIQSLQKKPRYKSHGIDPPETFTCVTCHPSEPCIATGTKSGRIFLWRNIWNNPVKTVCHWHNVRAECLTFSPEGSSFLSGGHECVLVKWQYLSQKRDFLPRVGAPLKFVTCSNDNTLYAVSYMDNSIHLISNQMRILQTYQGLTKGHLPHQLKNPVPTGLMIDPQSNALVLNGKPGHLQFFSLHSQEPLYNLDIVQQNYVSPESLDYPLHVTDITLATFHPNGDWLATLELWDDGVMTPEVRLKFWKYSKKKQIFHLNTVVEMPHQEPVTSIEFRPRVTATKDSDDVTDSTSEFNNMLISAGLDGKFKLWCLVDDTNIYRTNSRWDCDSVGYYRDLPAQCATFSEDGAMIAAGFGGTVTLWNPDTNALKNTFPSYWTSYPESCITALRFGRQEACHLLASSTQQMLNVWNVKTLEVYWSILLGVSVLVQDPCSCNMAVFSKQQELFIFDLSRPEPSYYSHGQVTDSDVISAVFVPPQTQTSRLHSRLYFLTSEQELLTLGDQETDEDHYDSADKVALAENLPQTAMSHILAEHRRTDVLDVSATVQDFPDKAGAVLAKELASSAPHVLPPTSTLCSVFLQKLIISRKGAQSSGDEDEDEDDEEDSVQSHSDSDMEVDVDVSSHDVIHPSDEASVSPQNSTSVTKSITSQSYSSLTSGRRKNESHDSGIESQNDSVFSATHSVVGQKLLKMSTVLESYDWINT